jgi:hypothetical protein
MKFLIPTLLICILSSCAQHSGQDRHDETFPPLQDNQAPQSLEALWKDYDPRKEPLDVEILHEWKEDGVIMKVLRYRIGIFKGQKAMMAAIYGYPEGAKNLPGLVQIHGGGQYADYRAVLSNGKRGYATISLSWAGRINAPDYHVNPDGVKLFWENSTENPDYRITTDWGPLDAYHAPHRNPGNSSGSLKAQEWTLDDIESPRNNLWFLCAVGARRAITFLEEQEEVDPERIGVYGHSMGGKITVLTAADQRIKAAAPSCGGISNNPDGNPLYTQTIADDIYLNELSCPVIFLSPSNDFHGHLQDLPKAIRLINSDHWRVVSAPHHSHQDLGESEVTGLLWFDQHLKGSFSFPRTPETELVLKTGSGIPSLMVRPDPSLALLELDVYYTQQGENFGERSDRDNRKNRFWHFAKARREGEVWIADLPLLQTDRPLWTYANVRYPLEKAESGAGYYYREYTTETYHPEKWELRTHKIYNPRWKAPDKAMLAFQVRCEEPNILVVAIDDYATELRLQGGRGWQDIMLEPSDFRKALDKELTDWSGIMEFSFSARETLREKVEGETKVLNLGGEWEGGLPEFRNLRWHQERSNQTNRTS